LREKRGFLIEIDGFDQMMDEIREIVGFDVREIFGSIEAHQDRIIEKIQNFPDEYAVGLLTKIVEALQEENKLAPERAKKRLIYVKCLSLFTQARKARDDGDNAKARDLFQQVIETNPQYKRAHNNLGITLEEIGCKDEAEKAYRKEINFNPKDSHAYGNLIKLLHSQDRDDDALEIAKEAFRNDATDFAFFISLVALHKGLGNTSEADKYAADARKELPPDAWYHLASLECVSGNKEAAIENLRRAAEQKEFERDRDFAKHDPDFESIRNDPRFKEIVGDESA
jgi:tetratricopeptide (TPR) repeat protein